MSSPLAKMFAELGFRVDEKGLKQFDRKLKETRKAIQQNSKEVIASNNKADKTAKTATASQSKFAKEIRSNYAKLRPTLRKVNEDLRRIRDQVKSGGIDGVEAKDLRRRVVARGQTLRKARQKERVAHLKNLDNIFDAEVRKTLETARKRREIERRAHKERLREAYQLNRTRSLGSRYRGVREYSRAFIPGIGGAFAATQSTRAFQNYQGMQAGLTAATGSQAQASEEFDFLTKLSNKLGLFVANLGKSYTNLAANTRGTALEGAETRKIFEAVSSYARVLNLSAADQDGVFRALTQMVGKGQIYAEELRGQMGERLPGSIQAMAKAAGKSVPEMFKMMEDGELRAEDVFPKFSEELMKMANEAGALEQAMNNTAAAIGRFRTNVWLANKTFNESGYDKAVRDFFNQTSTAVQKAEPLWEALGKASVYVGKALEAPIELFGTLSQRLPLLNNFISQNATEFKILGAALIYMLKPLKKLFLIAGVLPFGLAAINDLIQNWNRDRSWQEWAVQIGLAAAALGVLGGSLRKVLRLGKSVKGVFGKGTTAATAAGGASKAMPVMIVGVMGAALGALGAMIREIFTGGWNNPTGSSFAEKQKSMNLPDTKPLIDIPKMVKGWFNGDSDLKPLLNAQGGISPKGLPFGPQTYGGYLNDENLGSHLTSSYGISKQDGAKFIGDVSISVTSSDPNLAGMEVMKAFKGIFNSELSLAAINEPVTEK